MPPKSTPLVALDGTPIPAGLSPEQTGDTYALRTNEQLFDQFVLGIIGHGFNKGGRLPLPWSEWSDEQAECWAWLRGLGKLRRFVFYVKFRIHGGAPEMRPNRFNREALKFKPEYSYLLTMDKKQRDLRHLADLIKQLARLLGINAADVHVEDFDSAPRAMRLCFRFRAPAVLLMVVFRRDGEEPLQSALAQLCAETWPAEELVGSNQRTICSWMAFLCEQQQIRGELIPRLCQALEQDGFVVAPLGPINSGRAFVERIIQLNMQREVKERQLLLQSMPAGMAASLNPQAWQEPADPAAQGPHPPTLLVQLAEHQQFQQPAADFADDGGMSAASTPVLSDVDSVSSSPSLPPLPDTPRSDLPLSPLSPTLHLDLETESEPLGSPLPSEQDEEWFANQQAGSESCEASDPLLAFSDAEASHPADLPEPSPASAMGDVPGVQSHSSVGIKRPRSPTDDPDEDEPEAIRFRSAPPSPASPVKVLSPAGAAGMFDRALSAMEQVSLLPLHAQSQSLYSPDPLSSLLLSPIPSWMDSFSPRSDDE